MPKKIDMKALKAAVLKVLQHKPEKKEARSE